MLEGSMGIRGMTCLRGMVEGSMMFCGVDVTGSFLIPQGG